MRVGSAALTLVLFLVACEEPSSFEAVRDAGIGDDRIDVEQPTKDIDALTSPRSIIAALFSELERMRPTLASDIGDRSKDALLDDIGPDAHALYQLRLEHLKERFVTIDRHQLTSSERGAYETALRQLEMELARELMQVHLFEQSTEHPDLPWLAATCTSAPLRSESDVANLLSRYAQLPRYFAQRKANLEHGRKEGLTPPARVLGRVIESSARFAESVDSPFSWVTYDAAVDEGDRQRWQARIEEAARSYVVPAAQDYLTYLGAELLPSARSSFGVGALHNGHDYYRAAIQFSGGTTQTAYELHELGELRVSEIEPQLLAALAEIGVAEATLPAALAAYRTRPKAAQPEPSEALAAMMSWVTRLASERWAGDLWNAPMLPLPAIQVSSSAGGTAYSLRDRTLRLAYLGASLADLRVRTLHEYAHFLQDVSRDPSSEVSPYIRALPGGPFLEGGAHYAELVALEEGLYEDLGTAEAAMARISALSALMLRAVRVVVDTGIHQMDWSRDQAIEYMRDHIVDGDDFIEYEVDRYATSPGQALSYRLGMELILDQRRRAQAVFRERFDAAHFNQLALEAWKGSSAQFAEQIGSWIGE